MTAAAGVLLAADNPFADPVARLDVDVPPPPDVETIHGAVRAELRRAIGAAGAGGRAQMVLVTGDPGMGKTHELVCLQVEAQRAQQAFYFVDIPPLKDAGGPFRHVLRHFAQGLAGQNQLMRLLWESLRRVAAALRAAAWRDGDEELVKRLDYVLFGGAHYVGAFAALIQEDPTLGELLYRRGRALPPLSSLSAEIGRALCKLPDRDAQTVISEWLRAAELGDEDLALLGVRSSLDGEERCFEALQALVKLCPTPVALGFDQLEATSALLGVHGFVALFNALMEIYQQLPVCLVLMCQSQQWAELHAHLPQAAVERVRVLPPLARPTGEQATGLVAGRLAPVWRAAGVTPPYPSWPFPPAWIDAHVRRVRPTLRQVLLECGARLDEMRRSGSVSEPTASERPQPVRPPSPAEVLAREHAALAASLDQRHELAEPAARQERLRSIVAQLLGAAAEKGVLLGGVKVAGLSVPSQPRTGARPPLLVTLQGGRRIALEVYNDKAPHFALKRLAKMVQERTAEAGVLLRELGATLGEGPVTRDLLATLGPGAVVWIEPAAARRLVGAELLLDAVSASEVWIGERAVTRAEAIEQLLADREIQAALAPALGGAPPPELADRLLALLAAQGPTLSLARAAAALGVPEAALEPAAAQLTSRGRAILQRGPGDRALLVLMRGASG